jgi:DNA-binding NarL/FixJ family response regulator
MTSTGIAPLIEIQMCTRVSIVDDEAGIRTSLARLLKRASGFQCLLCYATAEEALEWIPNTMPDVVLMDINLPGIDGVECVRRIKIVRPSIQIIMLTVYDDPQRIFDALAAGATGYLMKHTPPVEILEAIREVRQGGSPMNSQIARKVVESFQKNPPTHEVERLSPREKEILEFLVQGYLIKEISDGIGIGFGTVRCHIRGIYEKLHVHSRTQAFAFHLGTSPKGRLDPCNRCK